jgi:NarL family two-component system response regulator LiaR
VDLEAGLERTKILIADDHALMRDGIRRILEREPGFDVVAEAGDGEEAIALIKKLAPDIAIIDIAMPKMDGIEVTQRVKELRPKTAVLILTAYDDDEFVFSLIEAGAAGYLLKSVQSQELIRAIHALRAGESVLHPTIARKVLAHFVPSLGKQEEQPSQEILTDRELEVLKLVTKGLSNKEIGDKLSLSVRTVEGHLGSIFGKLGVSSRTEAVYRALKEGWVTLDSTT